MSYQPGDIVENYRIITALGAGGMGAVYKVRNLITDRVEAMKVLLPNLQSEPDLAERFNREIKLHASLVHPHITAVHTAIRVENQLLMIMEFVEGISLAERLRHGPMEARESIVYVCQVLSALSYAHERGVVHRDVKPANIMITPEKHSKLMDFGIAIHSNSAETKLTMTGMALGSLHYMSPEQVKACPPEARSDLYSLGITLYSMVTGACPFEGDSDFAIMNAHLHSVPEAPNRVNPLLPPALSAAILRSIEKLPEARFQTANQFKTELEALLSDGLGQRPAQPVSAGAPPAALDPASLALTARELAQYIGPMAKILVDRAAKRCASLHEVQQSVANEITAVADREKFLAKWR